jgi:hypothetical protein
MVRTSVGNTVDDMLLAVPIGLVAALLLALAMYRNVREVALYRALPYLPSLIPMFAMSFIVIVFVNPQYGIVGQVLGPFGTPDVNLLGEPLYAKIVMVVMAQLGAGNAALIAGPFTWAGGVALTMPKGGQQVEGRLGLLHLYAGYEGQKILMNGISRIPTTLETIADPQGWSPEISFFVDLLDVAHSRPPLPVGTKLWDAIVALQGSLHQRSGTPEELVKEAQHYVDSTMQGFCPFELPQGFGEPDPRLVLPER